MQYLDRMIARQRLLPRISAFSAIIRLVDRVDESERALQ